MRPAECRTGGMAVGSRSSSGWTGSASRGGTAAACGEKERAAAKSQFCRSVWPQAVPHASSGEPTVFRDAVQPGGGRSKRG